MCGICLELHLMDLLEREYRTKAPVPQEDLEEVLLEPYAQESNFLMHCLKYARAFDMEDNVLSVVHCRALEEIALRPETAMQDSLAMIVLIKHYHAFKRFIASRIISDKVLKWLPAPSWHNLYSPGFIFAKDRWDLFLGDKDLLIQCTGLLERYHSWWLLGKGQQKNDLSRKLRETGIMDPIEDITRDEWQEFYEIFPAIYFALAYVSRYGTDMHWIEKIALTEPNGVPDFPGYDLWLKRKAFIFSIKHNGISFLLDNINPYFRPLPAYYCFLRLNEAQINKKEIIQALKFQINQSETPGEYADHAREYIEKMDNMIFIDGYQ